MVLSPEKVQAYYDRFGAWQDYQAFYEDAALDRLVAASELDTAHTVLEFGCGTGRLAATLLRRYPALRYVGVDVSGTMTRLARERLREWGDRASVVQVAPGTIALPGRPDRIVSTYVLDLLSPGEIAAFFDAARRALAPGGLVCLASLTEGPWLFPRLVSSAWALLWRVAPGLVGGCRPLRLRAFVDEHWQLEAATRVTRWGLTSEVLVARVAPGTAAVSRTATP